MADSTIYLKRSELKPSVVKALDSDPYMGLYSLEKLFKKDCEGHGGGMGMEDIGFRIHGTYVSIGWDMNELDITCQDDNADPIRMPQKVKKFIMPKLCC